MAATGRVAQGSGYIAEDCRMIKMSKSRRSNHIFTPVLTGVVESDCMQS